MGRDGIRISYKENKKSGMRIVSYYEDQISNPGRNINPRLYFDLRIIP